VAKKPSKKEAPALELADKLLRVLQSQRGLGSDSYPLTVQRLVELADAAAPAPLVKKVLAKRTFQKEVALAHAKLLDAPIALAADLALLAGSALILEFLLRQQRTLKTQAFTVPVMKKKATGKLQKPFQDAVNRHIADGTLPPTVGWISVGGRKLLFLLGDLHTSEGRRQKAEGRRQGEEGSAALKGQDRTEAALPSAFCLLPSAFDEAFERLDRQGGGHNFVSLVALRQALPLEREAFDQQLRQLRQAGRYTLSAAEGRDGISPEERAAGIAEEGGLLLFVSRNTP
jgi:hypothetical protein